MPTYEEVPSFEGVVGNAQDLTWAPTSYGPISPNRFTLWRFLSGSDGDINGVLWSDADNIGIVWTEQTEDVEEIRTRIFEYRAVNVPGSVAYGAITSESDYPLSRQHSGLGSVLLEVLEDLFEIPEDSPEDQGFYDTEGLNSEDSN